MNWIQLALSGASALTGGFVGGWTVAFRLGRWRQMVEDRLAAVEQRLENGDAHVDAVPVIEARLDVLLEEVRAIRKEMREDLKELVTKEQCNLRHAHG